MREKLSNIRVSEPTQEDDPLERFLEDVRREEAAKNQQATTSATTDPSASPPELEAPTKNAALDPSSDVGAEASEAEASIPIAADPLTPVSIEPAQQLAPSPSEETYQAPLTEETISPAPVTLVATGTWEDPRITIEGKVEEIFPTRVNVFGKAQRSARIRRPDDSTVLVSAFGDNIKALKDVQCGSVYRFFGRLKEKSGSLYLNL